VVGREGTFREEATFSVNPPYHATLTERKEGERQGRNENHGGGARHDVNQLFFLERTLRRGRVATENFGRGKEDRRTRWGLGS